MEIAEQGKRIGLPPFFELGEEGIENSQKIADRRRLRLPLLFEEGIQSLHFAAESFEDRRQFHHPQIFLVCNRPHVIKFPAQAGQQCKLLFLIVRHEAEDAHHVVHRRQLLKLLRSDRRLIRRPGGCHCKIAGILLAQHQLVGIFHRLEPLRLHVHQVVVEGYAAQRVEGRGSNNRGNHQDRPRLAEQQLPQPRKSRLYIGHSRIASGCRPLSMARHEDQHCRQHDK